MLRVFIMVFKSGEVLSHTTEFSGVITADEAWDILRSEGDRLGLGGEAELFKRTVNHTRYGYEDTGEMENAYEE